MADLIQTEQRGTTLLLSLNRPPAHAMNLDMLRALRDLLPSLHTPEVRAMVIAVGGKFFSAGPDLVELFAYPPAQAAEFTRTFDEVFVGLFSLTIPVIACSTGSIAGRAASGPVWPKPEIE